MGIRDRLLHRNPQPQPHLTELGCALANGIGQNVAGKPTSQVEQEKLLAENTLLLTDPALDQLMDGMCKATFVDKGNILGGGEGKTYTRAIPKYVAASMAKSSLFRTSWLSESEARQTVWALHRHFKKIQTMLTEEELEEGGGLITEMGFEISKVNVISSVNGRMSKLVKSGTHQVEVQVGNLQQQKEKR